MSYRAISDLIIDRLSSRTRIDMGYRDIYSYALEQYISGLINTILFTAVAILLRIPLETAVFFIFYIPLRKYAGGIHAGTRLQCTILSLVIWVVLIYSARVFSVSGYWFLIAAAGVVFAIVSIYLFAPMDSEKRRLSPEKRIQYRSLSRIIVLMESILIVLGIGYLPSVKRYSLTAVMALLFSGILIVPYRRNKEVKKYENKRNEQPVD